MKAMFTCTLDAKNDEVGNIEPLGAQGFDCAINVTLKKIALK